jgi:hypothetical protein
MSRRRYKLVTSLVVNCDTCTQKRPVVCTALQKHPRTAVGPLSGLDDRWPRRRTSKRLGAGLPASDDGRISIAIVSEGILEDRGVRRSTDGKYAALHASEYATLPGEVDVMKRIIGFKHKPTMRKD